MPRASAAAAAGHPAGSPRRWRTRDSDRRNGCPIAPTIWRSGCSAPARRRTFRAASCSRRCPRWPVERSVEPPRATFPSPCSGWAWTWRTARRSGCWKMRVPACRISPAGWKKTAASFWRGPDVRRASLDPIWPEPSGTADGTELAWHCVDACLRPQLVTSGELSRIPQTDWFALLHATARPQPVLTAQVAITLVLHVLSPAWARNPAACRHAALRLFLARPEDLRGDLRRLCASLPPHWALEPAQLPAFVAAAAKARVALMDASGLCARMAASARARPGGLALLGADSAPPASPEELGALFRNMRKYGHMGGFRQLLSLL